MKNNTFLQAQLRKAARRLRLIGSARALVWGAVAAVVLLVFAIWLDLLWELSPTARIAFDWGAGAAAAMLFVALAYRTARTARPAALARRLDIAVNSSGEILTGWELDQALSTHHAPRDEHPKTNVSGSPRHHAERDEYGHSPLTAGLATMAAEHAESLARRTRWRKPCRPNRWAGHWRSWPPWRLQSDFLPWPCPIWSRPNGTASRRWRTCRPIAPCGLP